MQAIEGDIEEENDDDMCDGLEEEKSDQEGDSLGGQEGDPAHADAQKSRRMRLTLKNKLPKKSTEILKNWFLQNIHNPYPKYDLTS